MTNDEYLAMRRRIKSEEGPTPPNDVVMSDLLKKLAERATEPHDFVCEGIHCRHARAAEALVEVNNAIAACQKDNEDVEKALVEQLRMKTGQR